MKRPLRIGITLGDINGIGPARAEDLMERCSIARSRRLRGLGEHQQAALLAALGV